MAVEWIYFLPTFDQPDYVIKGNPDSVNTAAIERNRIDQKFCPGYRIEAELDMACMPGLIVGYTNFDQRLTASKSSPIADLSSVLGTPLTASNFDQSRGQATLSERFKFDVIDGLIELYGRKCNQNELRATAGIKYARLHFTDDFFLSDTPNSDILAVQQNLKSIAIGPQLGFSGGWCLPWCLKLHGALQGALLASGSKTSFDQNTSGLGVFDDVNSTFSENPDWFWHVIESLDFRVGLRLETTFCLPKVSKKIKLNIEGGYELITFLEIINKSYFYVDFQGLSMNLWSDFTLQGPFVRLGVSY